MTEVFYSIHVCCEIQSFQYRQNSERYFLCNPSSKPSICPFFRNPSFHVVQNYLAVFTRRNFSCTRNLFAQTVSRAASRIYFFEKILLICTVFTRACFTRMKISRNSVSLPYKYYVNIVTAFMCSEICNIH